MCCDQCEHYFGCEEMTQQTACCRHCGDLDECQDDLLAGHRVVDDDDDGDFDYDDDGDGFDDDDDEDDLDDLDDLDDDDLDDDDDDDDYDDDEDDDDSGYLHDSYRPVDRP